MTSCIKGQHIKLDLTKPLLTQQGHPVRILATDVCGWRTYRPNILNGDNTQQRELRHDLIIGLVRKSNGVDETRRWTPEGFELNEDAIYNLVQKKVKKWLWVYRRSSMHFMEITIDHYPEPYIRLDGGVVIGRILETQIEE